MANPEPPLWCVRAGRIGEANDLFLKSKYVALDGPDLGDLSALPKDREAFKSKIAQAWPHLKPAAIPNQAGQYYRFIHEMQTGDIVLYPSKIDRQVHFGRVDGPYTFDTAKMPNFVHRRAVKWLKEVPRTRFSQGALYEIGSALGFFQVKNYAEEFRAALEGKASGPVGPADPTVRIVAQEIEENTRDFILKRLATELKGHAFAEFVAHLMGTMGYRTRVSPEGPDRGVDIVAHKDELGFEPPIIKVQVKSTEGSVGDPIVSALYGKVAAGEFGLLVTLGTITNQAKTFAQSKSNLRLIDGEELVGLILQHYEQFDSRYKGLLPLKRVYVPEPLEEERE
jgi:restriction system protein